ncbi:MAG TPA: hypothetical protein VJL83_01250 [Patescibacteria group bacterium]|nr:hypothetical protein [Patescibacteria group bacterium]
MPTAEKLRLLGLETVRDVLSYTGEFPKPALRKIAEFLKNLLITPQTHMIADFGYQSSEHPLSPEAEIKQRQGVDRAFSITQAQLVEQNKSLLPLATVRSYYGLDTGVKKSPSELAKEEGITPTAVRGRVRRELRLLRFHGSIYDYYPLSPRNTARMIFGGEMWGDVKEYYTRALENRLVREAGLSVLVERVWGNQNIVADLSGFFDIDVPKDYELTSDEREQIRTPILQDEESYKKTWYDRVQRYVEQKTEKDTREVLSAAIEEARTLGYTTSGEIYQWVRDNPDTLNRGIFRDVAPNSWITQALLGYLLDQEQREENPG